MTRLRTPPHAGHLLAAVLVGLAVLAAFGLRLYRISGQSLWYDEAYSLWLTQGNLADVMQRIIAVDNHPPLYALLLKGMVGLAGSSELAARFVSVLAGTLATAAMARLGGRIGGWPLAAVAAWLTALSPLYILYGQETRAYALSLLLGALALDAGLWCLRSAGWRPWALLAGLALLALYTHYASALLLLALGVVLACKQAAAAWEVRSLRRLSGPLVAAGFTGLGFLPWLPHALQAVQRDNSYYEGSLPLPPVLGGLLAGFAGAIDLDGAPYGQLAPLGVAFALLVGAGGWATRRAGGHWQGLLLGLALVAPVLAYALLQQLVPKFHPRYLLTVTPVFYLLAAAGLLTLWRWRRPAWAGPAAALALSVAVAGAWWPLLQRYYSGELALRQDWRGVSEALAGERAPDEPVVVVAGYGQLALAHYAPQQAVLALPDTPLPRLNQALGLNHLRALQHHLDGAQRMWLVEWQAAVMDPSAQLEQALQNTSHTLTDRDFGGVRLRSLALNGRALAPPDLGQGLAADFASLIVLEGVQLPAVPVVSGAHVPVRLRWRALQPPQRNYKVALRLLDQQRREWGRLDARPAGELNPTRRWSENQELAVELNVPMRAGTPPGEYALELELYEEETLAQVPAKVGQRPGSPLVTVGAVQVAGARMPAAALEPLTPARAEGDGLRLVGYRTPDGDVSAGEPIQVALAWEATGAPVARVRVEALGTGVTAPVLPEADRLLTHEGDRFLTLHAAPTPPEADGPTQVTVRVDGAAALSLPVYVRGRTRTYVAPVVAHVVKVSFGDSLELYGYGVEATTVRAGSAISLRLAWRPLIRLSSRLKVFVHLVDSSGYPVAQHDAEPVNDTLPTTRWAPGEFVEDTHTVRLPADMPPGDYELVLGVYHWPDGARLPVQPGDAYRVPIPVTVERR